MSAKRPLVVGIGEVLWDILPDGKQLGGAPANFTYFAKVLGADALLISRIGRDDLGEETLSRLSEAGLRLDGISHDGEHETGQASVELDEKGVARFRIHEPAAWDFLPVEPAVEEELRGADAICFGTLGARSQLSRATIQKLVSVTPPGAIRMLDLNLRAPFFTGEGIREALKFANMVKVNDEELEELSKLLNLDGSEVDRLRAIQVRYELDLVALTKGASGSVLIKGTALSCHGAVPTDVQDTIGAGDAFTAALVIGLLQELPLDAVHASAAQLAAYVCSQPGAMPRVPAGMAFS